jgi:hypothetical protein
VHPPAINLEAWPRDPGVTTAIRIYRGLIPGCRRPEALWMTLPHTMPRGLVPSPEHALPLRQVAPMRSICNDLDPCRAAHQKNKKKTVDGGNHRPVSAVVGISDVTPSPTRFDNCELPS